MSTIRCKVSDISPSPRVLLSGPSLVKWFPRRLPLVDFWKGSYTGFSIAYVVASVDFAALWQSIVPLFFVVMVYMGFLENYRFMTWLDDQDPTTE